MKELSTPPHGAHDAPLAPLAANRLSRDAHGHRRMARIRAGRMAARARRVALVAGRDLRESRHFHRGRPVAAHLAARSELDAPARRHAQRRRDRADHRRRSRSARHAASARSARRLRRARHVLLHRREGAALSGTRTRDRRARPCARKPFAGARPHVFRDVAGRPHARDRRRATHARSRERRTADVLPRAGAGCATSFSNRSCASSICGSRRGRGAATTRASAILAWSRGGCSTASRRATFCCCTTATPRSRPRARR